MVRLRVSKLGGGKRLRSRKIAVDAIEQQLWEREAQLNRANPVESREPRWPQASTLVAMAPNLRAMLPTYSWPFFHLGCRVARGLRFRTHLPSVSLWPCASRSEPKECPRGLAERGFVSFHSGRWRRVCE